MINIEYQPTTLSDNWPSTRTIPPSGIVCHSTAWPGKDAQGIRDNFNQPNRGASIHAAVDDKRIIQCAPWTKRCGHVGSGTLGSFNNTHIGIEMCEPAGIKYNSSGSAITSYNPDPAYFPAAWKNMVELFAHLCKLYNLDPLGKNVIVSHKEACALGYGGNHGDPDHWFPYEGKTMDDFRRAVAAALTGETEEDEVRYSKLTDIPNDYGFQDVIGTLMTAGIIKGDGSDTTGNADVIDLSHDQVRSLVFEYRGGAFDRKLISLGMAPAVEV